MERTAHAPGSEVNELHVPTAEAKVGRLATSVEVESHL